MPQQLNYEEGKGLSGADSPPQRNAPAAAPGLLSGINVQFVKEVRSFHSVSPLHCEEVEHGYRFTVAKFKENWK